MDGSLKHNPAVRAWAILLVAVALGGWVWQRYKGFADTPIIDPVRAAFGAYLFAFLQWLGLVLQPSLPNIPSQVLQVAPFPLMILTLLLAMRDKEDRVRFSGYDVSNFKVFTFCLAAALSGIGGALFTLASMGCALSDSIGALVRIGRSPSASRT